jgi:hypothetical protein
LKEKIDLLIQKITQTQDSDDIVKARQDYQKRAGEIYEDDRSYEARMGLFLEWYVFDRKAPGEYKSPLELFFAQNGVGGSADEWKNGDDFINSINGIFIVKKINGNEVVALNLIDGSKYSVKENEGNILFHKNDLFEGRIVLIEGNYHFTGNFCFHPKETEKFIKGEAKKIQSIRDGYLKELKAYNSKLKGLSSQLDKNAREIEKITAKVQKSKYRDKILAMNEKLETLKKVRAELTQQISTMEAEKTNLETQKIKNEIGESINHLIQRLGYMNLKWERSRQIDLHDIYCN